MARIISITPRFLKNHPKAGQPTFFIEKIWTSLLKHNTPYQFGTYLDSRSTRFQEQYNNFYNNNPEALKPKHHTIRLGRNYKTGQKVALHCWEQPGGMYVKGNKSIHFTPDLVVTVHDIEIFIPSDNPLVLKMKLRGEWTSILPEIALNDGLLEKDFKNWFLVLKQDVIHEAQIICWGANYL